MCVWGEYIHAMACVLNSQFLCSSFYSSWESNSDHQASIPLAVESSPWSGIDSSTQKSTSEWKVG